MKTTATTERASSKTGIEYSELRFLCAEMSEEEGDWDEDDREDWDDEDDREDWDDEDDREDWDDEDDREDWDDEDEELREYMAELEEACGNGDQDACDELTKHGQSASRKATVGWKTATIGTRRM